jgi:DivIVA domain-containing protein
VGSVLGVRLARGPCSFRRNARKRAEFRHTRTLVRHDSVHEGERESELSMPKEFRNVSFPGSVRGYDRSAVDAYVERVNGVIAEIEVRSSPRAAVRHALEQVGEQTSGILQRARETAEEITASARQEAEDTTGRAKAEAAEMVVHASTEVDRAASEAATVIARARTEAQEILAEARAEAEKILARAREEAAAVREEAEARLRELHADIAATWKERRELLDDVRAIATRLQEEASRAAARVPPQAPAKPAEEVVRQPDTAAYTEPSQVATTD